MIKIYWYMASLQIYSRITITKKQIEKCFINNFHWYEAETMFKTAFTI